MRDRLADRPEREPPSTALREAVKSAVDSCADRSGRALSVVRLILETPALLARFLERQEHWRDELTDALAERLGDHGDELYRRLAAGMALTAFHTVLRRWSDGGGAEDPAALTDRAFAVLAPALDAAAYGRAPAPP